jgi:hypothetical protein
VRGGLTRACYTAGVTRYDLFRKRLAPIAFALAVVLMARDACNRDRDQRTHATLVFDLGSASRARAMDAELWMGQERVANFHQDALHGALTQARFDASLPADDGELRIGVDVAGALRQDVRHFHAEDGSTVTVPLADLAK